MHFFLDLLCTKNLSPSSSDTEQSIGTRSTFAQDIDDGNDHEEVVNTQTDSNVEHSVENLRETDDTDIWKEIVWSTNNQKKRNEQLRMTGLK